MAATALRWLLIALCAAAIDGRSFRYDYTWSARARGWFKLHEAPVPWYTAMRICHAEGSVLASPINEEVLAEMVRITDDKNITCAVFTGVHSTFATGVYTSVEGVPLGRLALRWARDEPDAADGEACVVLLRGGRAADERCDRALPFLCYKKLTKTDVPSGCGTVDDQYTFESTTGNCYKFHWVGQRWADAFMTCVMEGGHLAVVDSAAERTLLMQMFAKHPATTIVSKHQKNVALLGYVDWNETGEWFTVHGTTLTEAWYPTWAANHPHANKVDGRGAHCGGMMRDGLLFAQYCHQLTAFVCEKTPDSLLRLDARDDDEQ